MAKSLNQIELRKRRLEQAPGVLAELLHARAANDLAECQRLNTKLSRLGVRVKFLAFRALPSGRVWANAHGEGVRRGVRLMSLTELSATTGVPADQIKRAAQLGVIDHFVSERGKRMLFEPKIFHRQWWNLAMDEAGASSCRNAEQSAKGAAR